MKTINEMVKQVTDQAIEEASNNHRFYASTEKFSSELGEVKVKVQKRSGAMGQSKIGRGCFAATFELNGKRIARAKLEEKMTEAAH